MWLYSKGFYFDSESINVRDQPVTAWSAFYVIFIQLKMYSRIEIFNKVRVADCCPVGYDTL
jgi:hypothetical protein